MRRRKRKAASIMEIPEPDAIDEAIIAFLWWDDAARDRLAATGAEGVRRLLRFYFDKEAVPAMYRRPGAGRQDIDRRAEAMSIVAEAAPNAFLEAIEGRGDLPMNFLSILGRIDDQRAVDILCKYVDHEDWLRRYNAVRGLVAQRNSSRRPCIERALQDANSGVQGYAIAGISQWDRARALRLYEEMVQREDIAPVLRQSCLNAIDDLKEGRQVDFSKIPK